LLKDYCFKKEAKSYSI